MSLKEIHNFDYAVLLCAKLPETKAFYRDVMGFPIEVELENWVSFRVGATLLTLRPRGPAPAWEDGPALAGSAAVQLAFRVPPPAVDVCHAELLAQGVTIVRGPTDLPQWRHRTLFFRDPEDNVIEVYAEY
jgi:catechol 2,3-dioxygenase-like lactoylglutathione lyase family enzyme